MSRLMGECERGKDRISFINFDILCSLGLKFGVLLVEFSIYLCFFLVSILVF